MIFTKMLPHICDLMESFSTLQTTTIAIQCSVKFNPFVFSVKMSFGIVFSTEYFSAFLVFKVFPIDYYSLFFDGLFKCHLMFFSDFLIFIVFLVRTGYTFVDITKDPSINHNHFYVNVFIRKPSHYNRS